MTFTIGATESVKVRLLRADGKSTGIFLSDEEAVSLLINGAFVRRSALQKMFAAFPHRLEMLRKVAR